MVIRRNWEAINYAISLKLLLVVTKTKTAAVTVVDCLEIIQYYFFNCDEMALLAYNSIILRKIESQTCNSSFSSNNPCTVNFTILISAISY